MPKPTDHSSGDEDYPWYFHLTYILPIVLGLAGIVWAVSKWYPAISRLASGD